MCKLVIIFVECKCFRRKLNLSHFPLLKLVETIFQFFEVDKMGIRNSLSSIFNSNLAFFQPWVSWVLFVKGGIKCSLFLFWYCCFFCSLFLYVFFFCLFVCLLLFLFLFLLCFNFCFCFLSCFFSLYDEMKPWVEFLE